MEITREFLQTRMQNFEINVLKSILIQISKSFPVYSNSYKHNALKILYFLLQEFLSYLPVKFIYFAKSRLFFNTQEFLRFKTQNFLVLFLHGHEHIEKFLISHQFTFNILKDFNSGVSLVFA